MTLAQFAALTIIVAAFIGALILSASVLLIVYSELAPFQNITRGA